MKNSLFTLNKTQENTKFIACYPAPGKCQWIACFLESFSIVIPSARTLHFPSIFPQNYQWWMPWKNDVCRLFSCFTKTLVYTLFSWTFFYSFLERANPAFFKRFPTDSLTANAIKTWCLSIVFLLHENASVYLVFLNVFYSFAVRTNATFSKRVHTITNSEGHENVLFVYCFPALGKRKWTAFIVYLNVFCSFREHTSAVFFRRFHTELLMVNAKKTWCLSIIFLLHGNANG